MVAVCGERGELGKCMGVRNGVIMNNNKKRNIRSMPLLYFSMLLTKRAQHGNI